MSEKFSLKDHLFNKEKVEKIAGEISKVFPYFEKQAFSNEVLAKFPELELKARISWIVTCLEKFLPGEYPQQLAVLVKALPPPNNPDLTDDDLAAAGL